MYVSILFLQKNALEFKKKCLSDNSAQYIYETEPFCCVYKRWKTQIDSLSIKNLDLLVMNMIFILTQCIYSVFVIKLIVHLIAIYWH